jgi:hypothetical protein
MLPKIDTPIYEVKLISTGKVVQFRPFLVKEQKLFLMNTENDDVEATIKVIRQVLKNCVLNDIDVDALPVFDLEYLFMHLRARSVSEVVNLKYRCNNIVKDDKGGLNRQGLFTHKKKCIILQKEAVDEVPTLVDSKKLTVNTRFILDIIK